jgi:hypothetical protein
MPFRILPVIALLCILTALHAQSGAPARHQLYGGYSFFSNSINGVPGSRQPLNGWDASMAFFSWHNLRFKIDVSAYRGTNLGAPQHPLFLMGGGQYSRRIGKESVFAEAMLGEAGMNSNWGANQQIGYTASITTFAGGGLDTPLSRHFKFRVSGGLQYAYFNLGGPHIINPYRAPGLPSNFGRVTSGLVWQF